MNEKAIHQNQIKINAALYNYIILQSIFFKSILSFVLSVFKKRSLGKIDFKTIFRLLMALILILFLLPAQAENQSVLDNEKMSTYKLSSGDTIIVSVYREPDLTLQSKLTDAGTIIFPFLGEISASGLTVGQLKERITTGLTGRYLVDPKVTVSVTAYREFFVNGEVKNPGAYPYFPGLNTQKAISMAGGFSDRASQSEVLIVREKDNQTIEVGLDAFVLPGDVVIVEESFF